jgi:cytoskeleton protein RodZ
VSTKGGRSRTTNEEGVTRSAAKRHLRIVKDELGDAPFVGGAMSLARDECSDDRPPADEGPGVWLRRNREAHALTVEDVARTTKISKTILAALESSDPARLPADIYTRGFVKAYAREVGLDPDATAEEYLAEIHARSAPTPSDVAGHAPPPAHPPSAAAEVHDGGRSVLASNQLHGFGWVTTGLALIGLIVYLVAFGEGDSGRSAAGKTPAEAADGSDVVAASHVTGETGALTPDAARVANGPLRVELTTRGLCWLVISVDGEPVMARLLQPGEHHTFDVEEEAVMRVGDPGALTLILNGETGRPLGAPGEPVDIRITPRNFQQYLGAP